MGLSAHAKHVLRNSLGLSAANELILILDCVKDHMEAAERPPASDVPPSLKSVPETSEDPTPPAPDETTAKTEAPAADPQSPPA